MKKIFVILGFFLMVAGAQAQRDPHLDSLDLSEISGTDTVVFRKDFGDFWGVEFEYSGLDADNATLGLGTSNYGNTYNEWANDNFPFILNVTGNTAAVNGTNKTTVAFTKREYGFRYFCIKITKGSVTSGKIYWYYTQN
jgi:hypothetical protein